MVFVKWNIHPKRVGNRLLLSNNMVIVEANKPAIVPYNAAFHGKVMIRKIRSFVFFENI